MFGVGKELSDLMYTKEVVAAQYQLLTQELGSPDSRGQELEELRALAGELDEETRQIQVQREREREREGGAVQFSVYFTV